MAWPNRFDDARERGECLDRGGHPLPELLCAHFMAVAHVRKLRHQSPRQPAKRSGA